MGDQRQSLGLGVATGGTGLGLGRNEHKLVHVRRRNRYYRLVAKVVHTVPELTANTHKARYFSNILAIPSVKIGKRAIYIYVSAEISVFQKLCNGGNCIFTVRECATLYGKVIFLRRIAHG